MNISVQGSLWGQRNAKSSAHRADHSALCLADKQVDKEKRKRGQAPSPPESAARKRGVASGGLEDILGSASSMMLRYLVLWLVLMRRKEGKLKRYCNQGDPAC